jgi:hypothetical protein
MSCRRPLALSQAQLLVVMSGAHQICPDCRDGYLQAIANQLTGLDNFTDADVARAVSVVMLRMGEAA